MTHTYSNEFYDYIEKGSRRSAKAFIAILQNSLDLNSVLDVGCGRGAWLSEWRAAGIEDVIGVDGDYVIRENLHFPSEQFCPANLEQGFDLDRKFDLAQCLEVAEHLREEAAKVIVQSIARHSNIVVFSAATPGQGGENHINEQPISYWREIFEQNGFEAYDFVRPNVQADDQVEPWYRYNTLLYANALGRRKLSKEIINTHIPKGIPVAEYGSLGWKMRKAVVRTLPRVVVNKIAAVNAARMVHQAKKSVT